MNKKVIYCNGCENVCILKGKDKCGCKSDDYCELYDLCKVDICNIVLQLLETLPSFEQNLHYKLEDDE